MQKTLMLLLLFSMGRMVASGQQLDWAIHWGPSTNQGAQNRYCKALAVAVDQAGNSYCTGNIVGINDLDPGPGVLNLGGTGNENVFVCKLDSNAALVWAVWFGGPSTDEGLGIATDAAGNVYVTGRFNNTVDFDPGPGVVNLTSNSGYAAFVSKFDPNGNFVWAHALTCTSGTHGTDIAVDHAGNVVIAGQFAGYGDFDPGAGTYLLNTGGGGHVFVTKWDAAGNFIWAGDLQAGTLFMQTDVAIDASNNVITTGSFNAGCDFDPGVGAFAMYPMGPNDVFVSKLDPNGNFVWAKQLGGSGSILSYDIDVDLQDQIFLTGRFEATVDFDPDPSTFQLTSSGSEDIFVCKLTDLGKLSWAKQMGGTGIDLGMGIGLRSLDGHVFTSGQFTSVADFDPNAGYFPMDGSMSIQGFLSELDGQGNLVWAGMIDGLGTETPKALGLGPDGDIYCTGHFRTTADFDPGQDSFLVSTYSGLDDGFLLRLNTCPSALILQDGNTLTGYPAGASYQWIDCGNGNQAIPGATGQSYTITSSGNYAVVVQDNGCSDTSQCLGTVLSSPMASGAGIQVFPNPATDWVQVRHELPIAHIQLVDMAGRVLAEWEGDGASSMRLGLGGIPIGCYLLRVRDAQGGVGTVRLMRTGD